jgi:hypothetical protein
MRTAEDAEEQKLAVIGAPHSPPAPFSFIGFACTIAGSPSARWVKTRAFGMDAFFLLPLSPGRTPNR